MSSSTETRFQWRFLLVTLAILALMLVFLSKFCAYVSVSFILAYLLEPAVSKLVERKISRPVAAASLLCIVLALLVLGGILAVPTIIDQAGQLIDRIPAAWRGLVERLGPVSERFLGYNAFSDFEHALTDLGGRESIVKPLGGILQNLFSTSVRILTTLLGFLIIPLLAFYLLKEYPYIWKRFFLKVIPRRNHATANQIRERMNDVLGGFIRGQLIVSSILSVYYAIALGIAGIDIVLVLGILSGFLNMIPYLGITSMMVLSCLIALIGSGSGLTVLTVAIIYAVGMALEGVIITPKIVGKQVGLSPLALVLALLIGGELFGIVGMLVAIPVAAMVKVIAEMAIEQGAQ